MTGRAAVRSNKQPSASLTHSLFLFLFSLPSLQVGVDTAHRRTWDREAYLKKAEERKKKEEEKEEKDETKNKSLSNFLAHARNSQ
jgi:hypothetical protein